MTRYRTVDLLATVLIGAAFGVAFLGYGQLYTLIGPLTAAFKPAEGLLAGLNIGGGARYVGYSWGNDAHDFKVPSYTLFDASIGYDLSRVGLNGTSIRLNANNLTDEYYVASCYNASSCYLGAERNVVATITHQF